MNGKNKQADSYGIVGLGRFGFALALELAAAGADLLVLDRDEEKISRLREYTENAFVVRNLDKSTLLETGIQSCDVAVVCIGEQMDTSILTTLNLVSMHIPTVIAKATSAEHGEILEKLGAEVVYPERDMAIRLAHRLETSKSLDFIQLSKLRQHFQTDNSLTDWWEKPCWKPNLRKSLRHQYYRHRKQQHRHADGGPQLPVQKGRYPVCFGREKRP